MFTRLHRGVACALALAALVAGGEASASLVTNGGFEAPEIAPGGSRAYRKLSESLVPGWSTTDSAIELWANGFGSVRSYEGDQHLELHANIRGTVFQEILGVVAGQRLTLSFAHRARTQGASEDRMRVQVIDAGVDGAFGTTDDGTLFTSDYTAPFGAWSVNSGTTDAASGAPLRLAFTGISSANDRASYGNFVDDVRLDVTPIPLPAGVVLLGTGIVAFGVARRMRRPRAEA